MSYNKNRKRAYMSGYGVWLWDFANHGPIKRSFNISMPQLVPEPSVPTFATPITTQRPYPPLRPTPVRDSYVPLRHSTPIAEAPVGTITLPELPVTPQFELPDITPTPAPERLPAKKPFCLPCWLFWGSIAGLVLINLIKPKKT